MELIIGIDGMVGSALFAEASKRKLEQTGTTRRHNSEGFFLNLEHPSIEGLKNIDCAYICAGIVGYKNCEGNPNAYRVNVDGTIALAKKLLQQGTFIVFMSSDAVECMLTTSYGLQKAMVEMFLQGTGSAAIIRSGRIERHMLPDLCELLLDIGKNKAAGIYNFVPKAY
jgi:dTDP-4-dehydrorhamnose reductase